MFYKYTKYFVQLQNLRSKNVCTALLQWLFTLTIVFEKLINLAAKHGSVAQIVDITSLLRSQLHPSTTFKKEVGK